MSSAAQSLPIDISNLCKAYGAVKALDDVSLNIAAGEFLTLLGPSGSGKEAAAHQLHSRSPRSSNNFIGIGNCKCLDLLLHFESVLGSVQRVR